MHRFVDRLLRLRVSYQRRADLALFFNAPWLMPRIAGGDTGRKGREKEAKRQEDIARQREERQNTQNQFLSQLVPGSEEFNQLQTLDANALTPDQIRETGNQLVAQQQARIGAGGPATALEARTNLSVEGLRRAAAPQDFEQDFLNVLSGRPTTTPTGEIARRGIEFSPEQQALFAALRGQPATGDLGRIFQDVLARGAPGGTGLDAELERALRGQPTTTPLGAQAGRMVDIAGQEPDTAFTQELALLQDQINRQANARGLATSGIPIEQLGRAGVELAVRKAGERENIRRTREADVLDLMTRSQQGRRESLGDVERLVSQGEAGTQQQQAMLAALFGTGEQLRGREIGVEEAVTNLQAGRESNLTALLQAQTGTATQNLLELLSTQTGRAENLRDLASALREAERQRTEQLVGQLGTTAAAAGLAFIPGVGPFLAAGTLGAGQSAFGGQDPFSRVSLTPESSRGRPAGTDVGSLLAAQQAPAAGGGAPDIAGTLSRRKKGEDLESLLAALQAAGAGGG